ncbi:MAG: electron transfer flavoprotein subunit alpha [Verrucomicrobia bacterium]|nr:electron transfer flavoprotein subunit alpha [Verrucomicrobiota bacterium]
MEKILFLAYTQEDGLLPSAALEALSAALSLKSVLGSAELVVGLVGGAVQSAADQIAGCGASRVLGVTGPEFAVSRYSTDAVAAAAICKAAGATLVIAPGTSRWQRVLPGVAQRLGGVADTHLTQVEGADGSLKVARWYYRQRMEGVIQRQQRPWFLLVDPGSQPAYAKPGATAVVEPVAVELSPAQMRTDFKGCRGAGQDVQTIRPEAKLLFVAGAGWTKKQADGQPHVKDAEGLILNFLKASRASLGSSKSLVDLGGEGEAVLSFLTHLNQIGQTGSTPRHAKGLSTCCHGEEPHAVGWRFINERRAINLDANCGWARGKADVLYVADAFAVVSKLNALLTAG